MILKNMKLLFCSNLAKKVEQEFINLFPSNIRIGYIPSQHIDGNPYFEETRQYYKQNYSINDVICLDIDKNYRNDFIDLLNSCDILILSGGNAAYFLNNFKKRGLLEPVRLFAKTEGKGVIGISAGGIIMTPNINIGNLFEKEAIKNEESLGLVNFEFCPHFTKNDAPKNIIEYAKNNNVKFCGEEKFILINE
ncbi:MAG: Type 1 glutamine amidotransferase-like domain-containing protein [bacterium]|nr:Type 1 glutamine amidotransferase-like domain-containing protein [bacterium]